MEFYQVLAQVVELLRRQGRVSYRALKRQFALDDDYLEDLKAELIAAQRIAVDEQGTVLVWIGESTTPAPPDQDRGPLTAADARTVSPPPTVPTQGATRSGQPDTQPAPAVPRAALLSPVGERRQLTVLFCDLVESTALARRLDPEEYRAVVRAYQDACATVIQRFDGYIAQYLGDGLLVYFGYPQAHEDDARRAVHTGLALLEAVQQLNPRLAQEQDVQLAVRVGIHTGLVVVGEMGGEGRHERLALGDTPNLAARLQGLADPDTVVISAATFRLVEGYVRCKDLGPQALKGVDTPVPVYRVLGEGAARSRLEVAATHGLTPLVGRETEVALLQERWAQVTDGLGQVVVLSGEAGIGKSRLVQVLTEHVAAGPHTVLEGRGSPYHQHSALYPVIELWQRAWQLTSGEDPAVHLRTLETVLARSRLPIAQTVALLAALLALPLPSDHAASLAMSPQQQKHQTLAALVTLVLELAAQQPVLLIVEDLHWVDASTLEWLSLLLDQVPTARLGLVLTTRPDFQVPWSLRAHLTQLTLGRLARPQVQQMMARLVGGKALPAEVGQQIVARADGVPLFVEELTKTVLEAGWLQEREDHYALTGPLPPLAIPATLQDALLARLDRLAEGKAIAQLGAVLGRTFPHALLQAVSPLDDLGVWRGLVQLVDAEVLYQQGILPHATYTFKHALLQEAAYQSLLRSTRQQYHQCIAQVLAAQFPEIVESQPELLAHHYTEAGLSAQAVTYWQRAGQRAVARSAYVEAISHVTKGLEILRTLPSTAEHTQHELDLQLTLGVALMVIKNYTAPEVEQAYARAYELCLQVGDTLQRFPALWGLWGFYSNRGELQTARELGEQCLTLAQRVQDPALLLQADHALGPTLVLLGELTPARIRLEQGITLYDIQHHHAQTMLYGGHDPGVCCLVHAAWVLWLLGYPTQACTRGQEARALARALAHPYSVTHALQWTAMLAQFCRDVQTTQELTEAAIALAMEQGFPGHAAGGRIVRGWAQAHQGQEAGIAQITQGLAAQRATGSEYLSTYYLALLAEAYGHVGRPEAGLRVLTEALAAAHTTSVRYYEAELHRLRGALLLQHNAPDAQHAEACLHQALDVARRQEAKSLELRAAMSLSRLWQQQGKRADARALLADIYGWFTEGFDTLDLQEAKALLQALED